EARARLLTAVHAGAKPGSPGNHASGKKIVPALVSAAMAARWRRIGPADFAATAQPALAAAACTRDNPEHEQFINAFVNRPRALRMTAASDNAPQIEILIDVSVGETRAAQMENG